MAASTLPAPEFKKELIENGDGTYTLALSVTGKTDTSSEDIVPPKANVVLVIDVSGSMNETTSNKSSDFTRYNYSSSTYDGNLRYYASDYSRRVAYSTRNRSWYYIDNEDWYNGYVYLPQKTRLSETKTAASQLVDSLLANNKNKDNFRDIMEISLVKFANKTKDTNSGYNGTEVLVSKSTSATTLKNSINALKAGGGTNWQAALNTAKSEADDLKGSSDEQTSVIFLTDGVPTFYGNDEGYSDWWNDYGGQETTENIQLCWNEADEYAYNIVHAGYDLYNIFAYGQTSGSNYLKALTNYAYTHTGTYTDYSTQTYSNGKKTTDYFYDATDTEALVKAFEKIIDQINSAIAYVDVEVEDGVTSMTSTSVSANAGGTATGFKYYRSGGKNEDDTEKYDHTQNNGLGVEWPGAPTATFTNGKVDWQLGEDFQLENGVTYTITFVVWPSQSSLDKVADLNNGKVKYAALSDEEKKSIKENSDGSYSLKTNTDFPSVTYKTRTTKTNTAGGEPEVVTSNPMTREITNPDPVGLAGSDMSIRKIWASDLQTSRLNEILFDEEGNSKELTVTLDVFKGGEKYDDVTLGWDGEKYDWADADETIWEESFAVAPGVMVTTEALADYAKQTLTFGGKTYYILETGHDYEIRENDFKDYHFDLITEIYHPMIVDGVLKDVKFTYSGTTITGIESITPENEELSSLDAANTLRGGINLNKVVLDPEGKEYPTEDEFEFTIQLNNGSEVFVGDSIPWYSVNGNYYHDDDGNYISEDEAKTQYPNNYAEHGNKLSGTSTSVSASISITCLDSVRIANVPVGTTYTIKESQKDGFTLDSIDHIIQLSDGTEKEEGESTVNKNDRQIVGDIVPNRENNITFKNKMDSFPAFYVYHSSDNTIEKIFVNDNRVTRKIDEKTGLSTYTFSIAQETKSEHLYGGYFAHYEGQKLTDDAIKKLAYNGQGTSGGVYMEEKTTSTWAKDGNGTAYDGSNASAWKSTKQYYPSSKKNPGAKGTEMNPSVNTVYYLKEVPDQYFRPALYYTYDSYSPDKEIRKMYLLVPTDDALYDGVGSMDSTVSAETKKLYSKFTATWPDGTKKSVLAGGTADANTEIVNDEIPRGYLTVVDAFSTLVKKDSTYTWVPYFKTKDGVKVTSAVSRTITIKGEPNDGNLTVKDTTTNSQLVEE